MHMIAFGLEEDQQLIVTSVKDFARAELRERTRQLESGGVPAELHAKYHEMGLGGMSYPESLGGQGLGPLMTVLAEEELGWGDAGAAVALDGLGLFGRALVVLGNEAQQRQWLAPLLGAKGAGEAGGFAWSEAPSKTPGLTTLARKDGEGWLLNGRKRFVVNGERAGAVVVVAQVEPDAGWNGLGAFVVERGNPGLRGGPRHALVGLDAAPVNDLTLEDCRVPAKARLAGPEGRSFLAGLREVFARGALVAAARLVGVARAGYEYALEYAQARKAFGKPIGHFQAIAFLLSDMAMDVDSARWLAWRAAWRIEKRGIDKAHRDVAMASAQAADVAKRVANQAVQVLGGAGFVRDHPAEKWMRDASALALMAGTVEQANAVVAAELLGSDEAADVADVLPGAGIQAVLT
jgi:alkylation response protein AidB-like acyl-CoA dehydrogenase